MKTRMIAMLLTLALLLSLMPAAVLAEDGAEAAGTSEQFEGAYAAELFEEAAEAEAYVEAETGSEGVAAETTAAATSGRCGTKLTWKLDNSGVMTISGSGDMTSIPCENYRSSVKKVVIKSGVTSICDQAFLGCSSMTSITIPETVTSIGAYAFANCDSLTSIVLPESVTSVGAYAFALCDLLESVTLGNGVAAIDDYTFEDCPKLKNVTMGTSITRIGDYAFALCTGLESITFPESMKSIGKYAFAMCSGLKRITIPNGVTDIGDYAFALSNGLETVTISASVANIGVYVFGSCSSLVEINVSSENQTYSSLKGVLFNKSQTALITFPGGYAGAYSVPTTVESIVAGAFAGCAKLTSVRFSNTGCKVASIGKNAFIQCDALKYICIPSTVTEIGEQAFGYTQQNDAVVLNDGFSAYVYSGSAAETYCKTSGVNYVIRDQAVSNLASSASADGQVTLSWTGVSGATGYKISRGTSADGKDLCELDTTTNTSYTDQTITVVGTYYYTVEPYWMAGDERINGRANSMQKANIDTVPSGRSPFTDVQDTTEYYYQPVLWAVGKNITTGTTTTTFSPYETCTRAQIITFLWRAAGCPEPKNTTNSFTDVQQGAYYYRAVCWAAEQGIADTTAATFGVNEPCTRILAVTYMYRAAGSPSVNTASNPFTDVTSAADKQAVVWAVNAGVTNGTSATTFSPYETCTRGQIVTFLYRNR